MLLTAATVVLAVLTARAYRRRLFFLHMKSIVAVDPYEAPHGAATTLYGRA